MGDVVEHLVFDQRRFHVGDEQLLAPPDRGHGVDVELGRVGFRAHEGDQALGLTRARMEFGGRGAVQALGGRYLAVFGRERLAQIPVYLIGERPRLGVRGEDKDVGHGAGILGAGLRERKAALIVAGPTASGKSALAMALAREFDGVVINADALQVYAELRVLTARPSREEEAQVPHRLYGVWPAREHGTVGKWRLAARDAVDQAHAQGKLPILCGGTGMYLKLIVEGLAPVPPIPDEIRIRARARLAELGAAAFHAELVARDPVAGAKLAVNDAQRVLRAWEVIEAHGVPLAEFQARAPQARETWPPLLLDPPRWRKALWRRSAPCWRKGFRRNCRPCALWACPSSPPICAAMSI
jgi:hypothetical protein